MNAVIPHHGEEERRAVVERRVWDPLVRIFHWTLAAGFTVAWLTGDEVQPVHEAVGYLIAGLIALRIVWGFVGSRHARFADFVRRPAVVAGNLRDIARGHPRRYLGHSPAGGAMVLTLLATILVSVITGLMMAVGGYAEVHLVEEVHEAAATTALVLVILHLIGVIVASLQHRENMPRAMITGRKRAE
ncbi:MAG: cytochrome b/b6 domain-containing protein [Gammaproteobacteria bacterium]|jgi:cytochrome b|nr:cytochrome b/b6 domain-containing protein [Gammaproteobacteria bacterium]